MRLYNPDISDPQDPVAALDLFVREASAVNEYDYGDCMRIWNHELLYLKDHLKNTSPWALGKVQEMQNFVQFNPSWEVDSTREKILQAARELREHLVLLANAGRAA